MSGDFLTQAQAATKLGVGRDLLRRWIKSGFVPHLNDPETGRPILSARTLDAWQDRRGELAAEQNAA